MKTVNLIPGQVTLDQLREIGTEPVQVSLPEDAWRQVRHSRDSLNAVVQRGAPAYGINTGFGKLAKTQVDKADLSTLQHNLIRSHAVGVGQPLGLEITRLIMVLKLLSLARGYSGVRPEVIEHFISMVSHDILPAIPEKDQ